MYIPIFVALLAAALPAEELQIIPQPRVMTPAAGRLALHSPVRIALLSNSPDDRFAANLVVEELRRIHHLEASVVSNGTAAITIGGPGNPRIDAEIARRKLDATALDHDESYLLSAAPAGVLLAARTAEGIFYGVQTLRQLVAPGGSIPAVAIADWPALRYRALSVDISRGPVPTDEQF